MNRYPSISLVLLAFAGLCAATSPFDGSPNGSPSVETLIEGPERVERIYYGSRLYINCPVNKTDAVEGVVEGGDDEDRSLPYKDLTWYNGTEQIPIPESESKTVEMKGRSLYLNIPDLSALLGTYECRWKENVWNFRSIVALKIHRFEPSYTVTKGEDLKLYCKVEKPYPEGLRFQWYYKKNIDDPPKPIEALMNVSSSGDSAHEEEEAHIKTLSKDGIPDAVLKIEDAVYEDRAFYYCVGTTPEEVVTVGTLVRVKDKYAALWPFLGIVAEVIILCLVILICDKRAAKKDEDDGDAGADMGSGDVDGGASGLRQRK